MQTVNVNIFWNPQGVTRNSVTRRPRKVQNLFPLKKKLEKLYVQYCLVHSIGGAI